METVFIPRASVLTKHMEIFSNLAKFSAVTGYVPTPPAPMCETNSIEQESRLSNILRSLGNSLLKTSRGDYFIINEDDNENTVLLSEIRFKLTERKRALVQLIKKHETALLAVRGARVQCWKSMAKLQEYQLMVETQKSALKYNQHEKRIRTVALKGMEAVLDKWTARHEKKYVSFETKFLEEVEYREQILRMSADIKIDILEKLDQVIRTMMNQNKQNISDAEVSKFSRQLYSNTCRTYIFGQVENNPCQNKWIIKPKYETSILNGKEIEKKIKNQEQFLQKTANDDNAVQQLFCQ